MTFYFVGPFYPLRGGIAQYIGILGQKLKEREHTVKVLSFIKQFPKFLFPGQTQEESSREYISLDSQQVFTPWNPLSWVRTFLQIKSEIPDAVIFKYWMPFFAPGFAAVCALTKWFTNVRILYILDNVIPHERRLGDKFFTRLAYKWVDAFIVQSEVVRQDLQNWFPESRRREVRYITHPIYDCYSDTGLSRDDALKALGIDPVKKSLLFFGLVRQYKGLDILLEAMSEVVEKLSGEVHLTIAGEFYESEESYRRKINELSIAQYVTIVNEYIPNEKVSLYFRAADLLVLPYRSATQSGVIQIAYHFGIPVISTNVGGLPEVVKQEETGYLVPAEDPQALCDAIVRSCESGVREKMVKNIRDLYSGESWNEMMNALEVLASR